MNGTPSRTVQVLPGRYSSNAAIGCLEPVVDDCARYLFICLPLCSLLVQTAVVQIIGSVGKLCQTS